MPQEITDQHGNVYVLNDSGLVIPMHRLNADGSVPTVASEIGTPGSDARAAVAALVGLIDVARFGFYTATTAEGRSAALQDAIDYGESQGGGHVRIAQPGTYEVGDIALKRGVGISGIYPGVTPTNGTSWDLGFDVASGTILTNPGGTVFVHSPAVDLGTAGAIDGVIIERLGFDDVAAVLTSGAQNTTGLSGSVIRDLYLSNVTGLAFDLTNPMHIAMQNVKGSGLAQLLRVTSDYVTSVVNHQPGNSWFADLYAYTSAAAASLPTIHLRALNGANGTPLNYCTFAGRIQVNRLGHFTTQTGHHIQLEGTDANASINTFRLDGLDLEGYAESRIKMERCTHGHIEFVGHADATQAPVDLYARNSSANSVHSLDNNFILDMDDTGSPMFFSGAMKGIPAGVTQRYPLGVWWDSTKGGGAQIGTERLDPVDASTYGVWKMPEAYLDFDDSGGGIRHRASIWNSVGGTFPLTKALLGVVEDYSEGDTTITLPLATDALRQTVTIKKLGSTGTCTINASGGETIDGAASTTWLSVQYRYITLAASAIAGWIVVAKG